MNLTRRMNYAVVEVKGIGLSTDTAHCTILEGDKSVDCSVAKFKDSGRYLDD